MDVSITNISTTQLYVEWSPPDATTYSYTEYYNISYTPTDCTTAEFGHNVANETAYTITGLHIGMSYTVTVKAGNVLGESNSFSIIGKTNPTSEFNTTVYKCKNISFINRAHSITIIFK